MRGSALATGVGKWVTAACLVLAADGGTSASSPVSMCMECACVFANKLQTGLSSK